MKGAKREEYASHSTSLIRSVWFLSNRRPLEGLPLLHLVEAKVALITLERAAAATPPKRSKTTAPQPTFNLDYFLLSNELHCHCNKLKPKHRKIIQKLKKEGTFPFSEEEGEKAHK
ncbi:Uncharacterized protein Fot_33135 [Forsythia ovata]|uniref:Uncharacterized protein n=1 Tax=Forsythia ovata TaxID=205694 RepID=A0ABD1T9S5_9LAMI